MKDGLDSTGVPTVKELEDSPGFPSKARLLKGPVVVIECLQEIPCNPCENVCPFGVIRVGEPIINLPMIDEDKCTGCGACIAFCPGLAIFVVDYTFSKDEALISFPYEFLPIPMVGSIVNATDRHGSVVVKARVVNVQDRKSYDHTLVISIAVPKQFVNIVRGIAPPRKEKG